MQVMWESVRWEEQSFSLSQSTAESAGRPVRRRNTVVPRFAPASGNPYVDLWGSRPALTERNDDDWPVLAVALRLAGPIGTEDRDFFGTGVPAWTPARSATSHSMTLDESTWNGCGICEPSKVSPPIDLRPRTHRPGASVLTAYSE